MPDLFGKAAEQELFILQSHAVVMAAACTSVLHFHLKSNHILPCK